MLAQPAPVLSTSPHRSRIYPISASLKWRSRVNPASLGEVDAHTSRVYPTCATYGADLGQARDQCAAGEGARHEFRACGTPPRPALPRTPSPTRGEGVAHA